MHLTPELSTIINTIIGIVISVITAYLSHKLKQRDQEMMKYRREREAKQNQLEERKNREDAARDLLTLGMARTMLLDNYYRAVAKGFYSVTERDVYHALFEAYVGAGGNGVIKELAEKIVELPTESPQQD